MRELSVFVGVGGCEVGHGGVWRWVVWWLMLGVVMGLLLMLARLLRFGSIDSQIRRLYWLHPEVRELVDLEAVCYLGQAEQLAVLERVLARVRELGAGVNSGDG